MLPDCPVVATRPSQYPFPELCGTGVVHKLGEALLGADHPLVRRNLDLVALATIADVVPLLDENRGLAAAGLKPLAATSRPGLQALMRSARVDPAAVDAGAIGFRLAPRINAAGRLGRPDVALELVLTEDADEARRLADELEELNRERQAVEERILASAVAGVESMPEPRRRRRGYVLWGEDWHEGVIGIVASRLVERFHRPVVLITRSQDGWKGSGRSIASFDLHGALAACSRTSSASAVIGRPRASRSPRRASRPSPRPSPIMRTRSIAPEDLFEVGHASTPSSRRAISRSTSPRSSSGLAPFGLGNPDVTLLVPATQAVTPSTVGDGKHLRFRVRQHGRDAGSAIAFGQGAQLDRLRAAGLFDVAFGSRRTTGTGRSPRSSSSAGSSTPPRATKSSARGSSSSGATASPPGRPRPAASSSELALDEDGAGTTSAPRVRVFPRPAHRRWRCRRPPRLQPSPGRDGTSASRIARARRRACAATPPAAEAVMDGPQFAGTSRGSFPPGRIVKPRSVH